jgi:hypothetical protein
MTSKARTASFLLASALATGSSVSGQRAPLGAPVNMPQEVISLACAPSLTFEAPKATLQVRGGQDSFVRRIHAPGDLVTISGGAQTGVMVGQEFYVRRVVTPAQRTISRDRPATIQTVGWIRVYAVDPEWSLATVTHACDTIEINDYLEPFVLPQVPTPSTTQAKPEKNNYGRVMTGTDRRRTFGLGDYFGLDRGSSQGVRPGSRFVVFRAKRDRSGQQPDNFLYELGEAIAVEVKQDVSTLQVTMSRDAFSEGDLVAMRPE